MVCERTCDHRDRICLNYNNRNAFCCIRSVKIKLNIRLVYYFSQVSSTSNTKFVVGAYGSPTHTPTKLVSEKYRVRGWIPAAAYHKVSRFAPGRGAGCPTISTIREVLNVKVTVFILFSGKGRVAPVYSREISIFFLEKQRFDFDRNLVRGSTTHDGHHTAVWCEVCGSWYCSTGYSCVV